MEATHHRPVPLRFVWHHIQPQEAGGQTVQQNLVQLCDSCHYSIHRIITPELPDGLPTTSGSTTGTRRS